MERRIRPPRGAEPARVSKQEWSRAAERAHRAGERRQRRSAAVRHHEGVTLQPGLPPGTEDLLQRVRDRTGSKLEVVPVPDEFSEGPHHLEVWLDDLAVGTSEFWWDDQEPAVKVLASLREWLSFFLDEEFSDGWW